ncbi:MAG: tetratricopeptide repeat protein [Pirellulales bacterium]|nr:tetratricopeptide repeat protein [Pirellulales bacterium]
MKSLNVRLVAILLACGLVFGIAVYFLHAYQVRRNAYVFLRLAEEARQRARAAAAKQDSDAEEKEYQDAIQNLFWYVQLVPGNTDALEDYGWLLADVAEKTQTGALFVEAFPILERVLRQDASRADARQKLVEIYMLLGRYSDAREHLQRLPAGLQEDGETLTLLGRCQLAAGEEAKAAESLRKAIEVSPHRADAYAVLAAVLSRREGLNRPTEADELMRKLVGVNPDSRQAQLLYGRYLTGLAAITSMADARKHPILMEAMVPTVLSESVKHVIRLQRLPDDDPDLLLVSGKQDLLVKLLAEALKAYDGTLRLDDPDAVLLAAQGPVDIDELDVAALTAARDRGLSALRSELQSSDDPALLVAGKHQLVVDAMKYALKAFGSRPAMLRGATYGVLDDARRRALKTRTFAAEDRKALALDAEQEVVLAATRQVLAARGDLVGLRLSSNRTTLGEALDQAIQATGASGADHDVLVRAAKQGILVDVMARTLADHGLASADLDEVLQTGESKILSEAVEDARKEIDSLVKNDDSGALLLAAQCTVWKAEYDQAREYVRSGMEAYPDNVEMYALAAEIEQRGGKPDQGIAWLRQGLEATKGNVGLRWDLTNLLLDTGSVEEAEQSIEKLTSAKYTFADRRRVPQAAAATGYLRARVNLIRGDLAAASRGFESVRGGLTAFPQLLKEADLLLAQCYGRLGNADEQEASLRRILEVDPLNSAARMEMVNLLLRQGQPSEALKMYQAVFNPEQASARSYLAIAKIWVAINRQRSDPAEQDWTNVENALDLAMEKAQTVVDAAGEETETPSDVTPDTEPRVPKRLADARRVLIEAPILRSEALVSQGRTDDAEKLLLEARDKDPQCVEFWMALISLVQKQEDWNRAARLLDQAEQVVGDTIAVRLARARYLVGHFGKEAAERLKPLAEKTEAFPEIQRLLLWEGLLYAALRVGDVDQAMQLAQQVAVAQPSNVQIRFMLFEIALGAKDTPAMEKWLAEIEKIEGKNYHWLYGQAVLASAASKTPDDKRLDQALELLAQARQKRPSWSRLPLLAGGIYDQQGKRDLALENYQRAIQMGERNPRAIRRCAQLLAAEGLYAEADTMLARLSGQRMISSADAGWESRYLATKDDLTKEDLDRALELAREAATDSTKYADHVWLARVLRAKSVQVKTAGQTTQARELLLEAEQTLRHAITLAEANAAPRIELIQFFVETGQPAEAEKVLAEVRAKIPASKDPLALARCLEVMKQATQAQREYERALATAGADPNVVRAVADFYLRTQQPEQAEKQLEKIVEGKVETSAAVVKWARRQLASLLALRPGYQNRRRALDLIEKNLLAGSSLLDESIKADLLSGDPSRLERERAIGTLEAMPSKSPEEQFRLAQLYKRQGKWAEAKRSMQQLLAEHGDDPQYVATYAQWLMQRNDLLGAEPWLRKMEEIAPDNFGTVSLRAEMLFQQKRPAQVLALLKGFVGKPGAQPSAEVERLRLVATTLERYSLQMTDPAEKATADSFAVEAETLYRALVRKHPGYELLWAAYLGRQGRIDEALQLLERTPADSSAYWLSQVCSIVLKSPKASEEQVKRGEKVLQAALEKHDRDAALLMVLAEVRATQEDYDEAEAAYREILAKDGSNAIALNNLAVLLALQKTKLQESVRSIERAIELAGPVAPMLDSRATVHMAMGNPDKALADLEAAILENGTPGRYFHQAQAYEQANQRPNAIEAMKKANDLGLTVEMLHPLELPSYRKLQDLLK